MPTILVVPENKNQKKEIKGTNQETKLYDCLSETFQKSKKINRNYIRSTKIVLLGFWIKD